MLLEERRRRGKPAVLILALFSVTLIVLELTGLTAPGSAWRNSVRDGAVALEDRLQALSPFSESDTVRNLRDENERLKVRALQAEQAQAQSIDAVRSRDEMAALLALPTANNVPKVLSPVRAINTGNFDATLELGKGRADGVDVGMPVENGLGLVGRVVQATDRRSTVLLLSDTTSNVGVRFGSTGEVAVAVGLGRNDPLRVDLLDLGSEVKEGDIAVTSGTQGSLYPPGIPVGRVQSSGTEPQQLRKSVRLQPLVDTGRLDTVVVVQWRPPS